MCCKHRSAAVVAMGHTRWRALHGLYMSDSRAGGALQQEIFLLIYLAWVGIIKYMCRSTKIVMAESIRYEHELQRRCTGCM